MSQLISNSFYFALISNLWFKEKIRSESNTFTWRYCGRIDCQNVFVKYLKNWISSFIMFRLSHSTAN